MRRTVLIIGATGLLDVYLAAFRLASTEDIIFHAVPVAETFSDETRALLTQALGQIAPGKAFALDERLHAIPCDIVSGIPEALPSNVRLDETWLLAESEKCSQPGSLLQTLNRVGVKEFNYVGTIGRGDLEREVVERCVASGMGYRVFRTSLTVGDTLPPRDRRRAGFFRFLSALYDTKTEVEEHLPEYFGRQPLRCWAPPDARVRLMRSDQAAEIMLRIAKRPDTLGKTYDVGPESVSVAELCERIGMVYGLNLLSVDDRQSLNPIDRLFHERLNSFQADFFVTSENIAGEGAYQAVDVASDDVLLDKKAQVVLLEAILRSQNSARYARRDRIAAFPGSLERKTIARGGFALTYYSGGSGQTPIILLNALGQGLPYWYRLMDSLMQRHRVIIWEPRGTVSPPPPFGVNDQVDDLEAVLKNEGADTCYLIGWCTGPKIATEFYVRHPSAVLAMVFLNSTFRCLGGPEEYETDYEHNLEPLIRLLNRRPETAASVMRSLRAANTADNTNVLEESDHEELAARVLSLINADLKQEVLMPFRDESTMLNYSHQVLDFWSHNTLEQLSRIEVPVLVVGSEYDKSASPVMSSVAAERVPTARYVQLQGATHYCFYDRPDLIAELVEQFFHRPEVFKVFDNEARLIGRDDEVSGQSERDVTESAEPMSPSTPVLGEGLPCMPDHGALAGPDSRGLAQAAAAIVAYEAPSNEIERKLAEIWVEVFDAPQPGIHDNFFSMGAQSLMATQLVARISDMFKLHLPLKQVFETPTIGGLATVIQRLNEQPTQD